MLSHQSPEKSSPPNQPEDNSIEQLVDISTSKNQSKEGLIHQSAGTSNTMDRQQLFDELMVRTIQNDEKMDIDESQDKTSNYYDFEKSIMSLPFKLDDITTGSKYLWHKMGVQDKSTRYLQSSDKLCFTINSRYNFAMENEAHFIHKGKHTLWR